MSSSPFSLADRDKTRTQERGSLATFGVLDMEFSLINAKFIDDDAEVLGILSLIRSICGVLIILRVRSIVAGAELLTSGAFPF
jgi:hypothetical protein